jgi:hypothetical protein
VIRVLDTLRRGRERSAIMMRNPAPPTGPGRVPSALAAALALVAACSDATGFKPSPVSDVALAPSEFVLFSGAKLPGSISFPAAGTDTTRYLVVAQFAAAAPDVSSGFSLLGSVAASLGVPPAASLAGAGASVAQRFHDNLRRMESQLAAESRAAGVRPAAPAVRLAPAVITPPVVGAKRSFKVCANLDCTSLITVVATAKSVGSHAALFVDDSVPAGGFTPTDLAQVSQQFDTDLYPIDHAAFGAESDIDSNGVVIILLTPKVNALVGRPDCNTSFVTGFFFGADIDPAYRATYNNGEIFYGFVPDPAGTVSCAYSTTLVRRMITVTFIHEFQHMISFNQHVLVRHAGTEELWLNEALSHLAEELGGRHYDSLGVDTTASQFYIGDLYNAGRFLMDPAAVAMVTDVAPGELAQRGGEWLFVRYLTDRFGAQTPHSLVGTSLQGAANVAQVTGTAFATLLGRWALAVYTSDLAGFTPPAELRYESWHFRAVFSSLHTQAPADFPRTFPLVPATATAGAVSITGTLKSGSGSYLLLSQPPGNGGFSLRFGSSGTGFPAGASPQLAVVRLR